MPRPPRCPAPRCFFFAPHPWVQLPRCLLFFVRFWTTILNHPSDKVVHLLAPVSQGAALGKHCFHAFPPEPFSGRREAEKRLRMLFPSIVPCFFLPSFLKEGQGGIVDGTPCQKIFSLDDHAHLLGRIFDDRAIILPVEVEMAHRIFLHMAHPDSSAYTDNGNRLIHFASLRSFWRCCLPPFPEAHGSGKRASSLSVSAAQPCTPGPGCTCFRSGRASWTIHP